MKNYLLTVLEHCSDQQFGQDAVEWGIVTGRVLLTYKLDEDLCTIMAPRSELGTPNSKPGTPAAESLYDQLCVAYRAECRHRNVPRTVHRWRPVF